jgi:hypothetical protein
MVKVLPLLFQAVPVTVQPLKSSLQAAAAAAAHYLRWQLFAA